MTYLMGSVLTIEVDFLNCDSHFKDYNNQFPGQKKINHEEV